MKYSDPVALVRAAIDAVNRSDWSATVTLCDPVSLAAFKRELVEQYDSATSRRELTVEEYMRVAPDMPREVAEYEVARHRAHSEPGRRLREDLPGVRDLEMLRTLTPEAVFAAWLDGRGPRRQIERLANEGRISQAVVAHAQELSSRIHDYEIVGAMSDGDRVAHVLYRHSTERESWDAELEEWLRQRPAEEQELARDLAGRTYPQVVTCRRQPEGDWLMLAGHNFLGLGSFSIDLSETRNQSADDSDVEIP